MTITNGYATLTAAKLALGINDLTDDRDIEACVEAASRQIDDHCGKGRKFFHDATVVARSYYPDDEDECWVDDISTTTGLVVKVDLDDDGTFETTLTLGTDFILAPVNAAAEYPARPYTQIKLLTNSRTLFYELASGRPFLQVTAKFGWPAVPESVERACVMQTRNVFKAMQAQNGLVQIAVDGTAVRMPTIDPMARMLLDNYVRYEPVDDEC